MRLKPNVNIKSIFDINVFNLKACEIEAVFFDLDSTVMRSKSGIFDKQTLDFLNMLNNHFKVAIISNQTQTQFSKDNNYDGFIRKIDIGGHHHAIQIRHLLQSQ